MKKSTKAYFSLALTPQGKLHIEDIKEPDRDGDADALKRIRAAFERGAGHGLLHLGATEVTPVLPPTQAFWRGLGRLFMTGLCSLPDLESQREAFTLPPPRGAILALLGTAPPMTGGEYLSGDVLDGLWRDVAAACQAELQAFDGTAQAFLQQKNPLWNLVGRVHFHLAEQKGNHKTPFAFLATYTTQVSARATVRHLPLGKALAEYAGGAGWKEGRKKSALLALLRPVQAAAEKSEFLRELVDSGSIFHPLAWTPREAYQFLKDIPAFESSGVLVRIPDWWKARATRRPQVQVTVGGKKPSALGLSSLLDFSVDVVLDGEKLTVRELKDILSATGGLAMIRGRWVEIDSEKLDKVLEHWSAVEEATREGISFAEGMRLLAGAGLDATGDASTLETVEEWSSLTAGPWLAEALEKLRSPESAGSLDIDKNLASILRPYQKVGVTWLWHLNRLGLGGCLADDMGLGKTIQVLGLLLRLKRASPKATSLLVVPASLVANWMAEISRFAPSLNALVAHSSSLPRSELRGLSQAALSGYDIVITTYAHLTRLPWVKSFSWDVVALDEAQAIKNPTAKQTRAAKALRSRARLVLTGTPVENRLSDLWSLFDFINPGLLGTVKVFTQFAKQLEKRSRDQYGPLRALIRPYLLRRLKTDRTIIADLPDKTEVTAYCPLSKTQAALYKQSVRDLAQLLKTVKGIKRRGAVLAFLTRFKQICNHPSQWLGDGAYDPADSGKFGRIRELCEPMAERQEKVLVFTQYREMIGPLAEYLSGVFGRPGLALHGSTPVKKRPALVERFQKDESVPFFVISLRAGGTGLNLTAASHVIHFDRWWNPAVENQATDRAYRIGQKKNVLVHKFVCRGTMEENVDQLIQGKQQMSTELLEAKGEALITELDDNELLSLVALDIKSAMQET